jgi:SAM-dependent methyltransferase
MAFVEITGSAYTDFMRKRVRGELPPLTWLEQFRKMLRPYLHPGVTMLDVGCGSGYAYNAFQDFGVIYTGLDWEADYLQIGREHFAGRPEVSFILHDLAAAPLPKTADLVICSATLEHCPALMPALRHLVAAADKILLLRTFLGPEEDIHSIPSPVPDFRDVRKHTNQYGFIQVLGHMADQSFRTRVFRDEYTDSLPQYVDRAMRTFYVVQAEKIPPEAQNQPHAGWTPLAALEGD